MRRIHLLLVAALGLVPRAAWPQGNPLGPEFRVNTYTPSAQFLAHLATDPSGNFIVVWTSSAQDAPGFGVFGQRYDSSGTPLGPEFQVNTYTTGQQLDPRVASDASGNFVVAWGGDTQDGSGFGVFGQRYSSSGTPLGPEFQINTFTTSDQGTGYVAADSSGNFVVIWNSNTQDGSDRGIFGQRYASSGTPLGSEFQVNTYTTGLQASPSVASDAAGNFVVVWESDDGSSYGIFGQRYASSGAPLGPEFRVNTYTTSPQEIPSVASDSSGNFVVVWQSISQDGSYVGVFGQRYASTGTPLGPEFRVNTQTTLRQDHSSVAADALGNFVVVWDSEAQDGSSFGVFGQRYDNSGTPLGPEFQVNTYTTAGQTYASVAASSSGDFVVVWRSDTQDGSNLGVFGQRYGQIAPVELLRFGVE